MAGNVWEWCSTRWLDNYEGYPEQVNNDPSGDARRVVRGGGFGGNRDHVRCAVRDDDVPVSGVSGIGFRVVRHETARED